MRLALPALLIGSSVVWLALVLAAPFARAADRHWTQLLSTATYAAGARVCHQRPERSFHVSGAPLPVCARCFGLYLSGALCAVAALGARRRTPLSGRAARIIFAAAAVPTVATVALEMAGVWQPGKIVRAVAALPLGGAAGWIFVRMLLDEAHEYVRYHA